MMLMEISPSGRRSRGGDGGGDGGIAKVILGRGLVVPVEAEEAGDGGGEFSCVAGILK